MGRQRGFAVVSLKYTLQKYCNSQTPNVQKDSEHYYGVISQMKVPFYAPVGSPASLSINALRAWEVAADKIQIHIIFTDCKTKRTNLFFHFFL